MDESSTVTSVDLPTPMAIGRTFRLVLGVIFLSLFSFIFPQFTRYVSGGIPVEPLLWIGVAVSFFFLNQAVNVGFNHDWGRRPQQIFLLLAIGTIPFNFVMFGGLWGPPLGLLLYLLVVYFSAHVGASFILAAIIRTPGCEMASVHQLRNREKFESCEGSVDRLDRWEARWRRKD